VADAEHSRYALSFTSGGLLAREGEIVGSAFLDCRDWRLTRQLVVAENLLQARTFSSSSRVTREVIQRLMVLSDDEVLLLTEASPTERLQLMWVAVCRRYGLIGEFGEEVLREKFLLMNLSLNTEDLERFLIGKSLWHPELEELKPSTRLKLRQTFFRMLHEAGLLSVTGEIIPAVLSERVALAFNSSTPSDIRFFPTTTPIEVQP
jgi:hypothetical protein